MDQASQGSAAACCSWTRDGQDKGHMERKWPARVHTLGTQQIETGPSGCVTLPDVVWTNCEAVPPGRRKPKERQQPLLCHVFQIGFTVFGTPAAEWMTFGLTAA